ncbi:MAG: hypothetical protein ACK5Z4_10350 [Planctomyces sp.]
MIVATRIAVLWFAFLFQAILLAQWVARGSGLGAVAFLISLVLGAPLALLLALACARKQLIVSLCVGVVLIFIVSIWVLNSPFANPLIIAMMMPLIAAAMWLLIPDAPLGDGMRQCAKCGYSLLEIRGDVCPECGRPRKRRRV